MSELVEWPSAPASLAARHTYAIALDACSRQGGWSQAQELLRQMGDDGYPPARAECDYGLRALVAAIRDHGTRLPGVGPLAARLEGSVEVTGDEVRDLAQRCGIASPSATMINSAAAAANKSAAARAHARELLTRTAAATATQAATSEASA